MKKNKSLLFLLILISSQLLSMENSTTNTGAGDTREHLSHSENYGTEYARTLNLSRKHQTNSWLMELPDELLEKISSHIDTVASASKALQTNKRLCSLTKIHLDQSWTNLKSQNQNKLICKIINSIESDGEAPIAPSHFYKLHKRLLQLSGQSASSNITTRTTNADKLLEMADNAQRIQNENLELLWPKLSNAIVRANPTTSTNVPPKESEATDIQAWLNNPNNLTAIKQVTELPTTHSDLTVLSEGMNLLTGLKELHIYDNQSTMIEIPNTLVNLEKIMIFNNQFAEIEIPDTLVNLEMLWLDKNSTTKIKIPDTLVNLKLLFLPNNQLTTIDIPNKLTSLKGIDLRNNKLKTIDIADTFTNLESLRLDDNELTAESTKIPDAIREKACKP